MWTAFNFIEEALPFTDWIPTASALPICRLDSRPRADGQRCFGCTCTAGTCRRGLPLLDNAAAAAAAQRQSNVYVYTR